MVNCKYEIGQRIIKTDDGGNIIIDCVITNKQSRRSNTILTAQTSCMLTRKYIMNIHAIFAGQNIYGKSSNLLRELDVGAAPIKYGSKE